MASGKVKVHKSLQHVLDAALAQEWTVVEQNGHHIWTPPAGTPVRAPSTPSDYRGIKNHISLLKQRGLIIVPPQGKGKKAKDAALAKALEAVKNAAARDTALA